MMKGLSPQEVAELITYIQENNSWQNMMDVTKRNRRVIKYYDMTVDTRTGEMWDIQFRRSGNTPIRFTTGSGTFKQDIYAYLDEYIDYGRDEFNKCLNQR